MSARACNCSGANALKEALPCRTSKGARYRRLLSTHIVHATSMTNPASRETLLFTGLKRARKRTAQTRWNGTVRREDTNPSRKRDSCERMLDDVAVALPDTTNMPRTTI